ncbi:MAG TPA: flagellin [Rheinheimera sp.]|uniref:flagellin N-terminal helical domain-containing protein n=1 Tax=Rheinheimera sp. TaxID=1869214 RepID=UPI002F92FF00
MALSIQSNMASKSIQNQLGRTNNDLSVALERLGSGLRINSAKDDAAGLQIANRLNAQVRGQEAAIYNANNAMSMLQTAEGAFEEMTNIAFRMKELATQGANGTNNSSEYTAINAEFTALTEEMTSIMENTSFGAGTKLLDGGKFDGANVTFQIGSSNDETLEVNIQAEVTAVKGAYAAGTNITNGFNGATAAANQALAANIITDVDSLISDIGAARAELGASMNRLDHTINNVTNMKENTEAAAGQLMDADFAKETSNMTKQQLLMNSGISVLSASNSTSQMIGSLLR